MVDTVPAALSGWESFYVIAGSSGGALVGLQFVVIALMAQVQARAAHSPIGAWGTPNVVHFAMVLFVAAAMSAPWPRLGELSAMLHLIGLGGLVYATVTLVRQRRQDGYRAVWEDWVWHAVLPYIVYATLFAAPFVLFTHQTAALFAIGGAVLLLLFVGIHNSWDTVVYLVVDARRDGLVPPGPTN